MRYKNIQPTWHIWKYYFLKNLQVSKKSLKVELNKLKLANCICSDGYTYSSFFRHQPSSPKIMAEYKCSPLHARVIGLIHQLPDKYYTFGMDNLYMSAKLCRLAYGMEQKVMVHGVTRPSPMEWQDRLLWSDKTVSYGVTRPSLKGIHPAIKQNEVQRKGIGTSTTYS